jgi:predicted transposase YbfD/YdcC
LSPHGLQSCLLRWLQGCGQQLGLGHIAIDGKTLRHSGDCRNRLGALHLVSAWASQAHLSLGQVAVDCKSNEITAIPLLLQLLDLKGALVTIDAMGCQKKIAEQITQAGGDYVLTVKENQGNLFADILSCFGQAIESDFREVQSDRYETEDRGHGRHERRCYEVIYEPPGIRDLQTTSEDRYFIGSRRASAQVYGGALRGHWGIENNLHWQLDVTFGEDRSRIQQRNSAQNLALMRKWALSLLKRHPDKHSIAVKRFNAALDVDYLQQILDV